MNFDLSYSVTEKGRKKPEYQLNTDLAGEVTLADFLAFTQQSLVLIAGEVFSEEKDMGFDPNPIIAVDGSTSKPVEDVSPLGTIEITARADMSTIITDTYNAIMTRSPVLTGKYRESNFIFLNGQQVATGVSSLNTWLATNPAFKDSDVIRFVNIQPYGRKLERLGVTSDRQKSRTVQRTKSFAVDGQKYRANDGANLNQPNGVYYLTARSIRAKYKRNSIIAFSFIAGSSLGLTASFSPDTRGKRKGKPGRTYLYPTITISVQENGITG